MSGGEGAQRPRGRPKGSTNKRRQDLGRYIEAVHGSTPGEQLAKVVLVTRSELREARGDHFEAMICKAEKLAKRLNCKTAEAWALLQRGQVELMAYVHQKQPQAIALKGQGMAPAVLVIGQEAAAQLAPMDYEENQEVIEGHAHEVSRGQSHGDGQGPDLPLLSGS
jgi:hypothetical protein